MNRLCPTCPSLSREQERVHVHKLAWKFLAVVITCPYSHRDELGSITQWYNKRWGTEGGCIHIHTHTRGRAETGYVNTGVLHFVRTYIYIHTPETMTRTIVVSLYTEASAYTSSAITHYILTLSDCVYKHKEVHEDHSTPTERQSQR